jgi:hypothetical protein
MLCALLRLFAKILRGGFGAASDMELLENIPQMNVNGSCGDIRFLRNLFIRQSLSQKLKNFRLARRQAIGIGRGRRRAKRPHHHTRDLGRHRRAAGTDFGNRLDDFFWPRTL